jgi:hypothetical protein
MNKVEFFWEKLSLIKYVKIWNKIFSKFGIKTKQFRNHKNWGEKKETGWLRGSVNGGCGRSV